MKYYMLFAILSGILGPLILYLVADWLTHRRSEQLRRMGKNERTDSRLPTWFWRKLTGGMDDRDFSVVASSSSTGTAVVTVEQVVRGTIEAVYVSCGTTPAVTGTVAFASAEGGTIFSKSCSGSAVYYPRTASHTTAGLSHTLQPS